MLALGVLPIRIWWQSNNNIELHRWCLGLQSQPSSSPNIIVNVIKMKLGAQCCMSFQEANQTRPDMRLSAWHEYEDMVGKTHSHLARYVDWMCVPGSSIFRPNVHGRTLTFSFSGSIVVCFAKWLPKSVGWLGGWIKGNKGGLVVVYYDGMTMQCRYVDRQRDRQADIPEGNSVPPLPDPVNCFPFGCCLWPIWFIYSPKRLLPHTTRPSCTRRGLGSHSLRNPIH